MIRALFLFVLLSGPALAQGSIDPARYFPLGPDDRWLYAYERIVRPAVGEPGDTLLRYAEQAVVGDTTIDGATWTLVRVRQFERGGTMLDEGAVPMQVTDEPPFHARMHTLAHYPEIVEEPVSGTGAAAYFLQLLSRTPGPATVNVGGVPYPVAGTYGRADGCFSDGLGEIVCGCNQQVVAADIGLLSYDCRSFSSQTPHVTERTELVYAKVGGVVYGLDPVAAEPETAVPTALTVAPAFPNPFRETATLAVALPQPAAVRLTVFDVLGRPIHAADLGPHSAGVSAVRLDGSAWPPGAYLVRVEAAGYAATQRIVVVR